MAERVVAHVGGVSAASSSSALVGPRPRLLLISSSGGVLDDVLALGPWWRSLDRRWVAVPAPDTEELLVDEAVDWAQDVPTSQPIRLARAVAAADRDLGRRPVDLIVSAGTAVAVPFFLAARRRGVELWWLETFNMVGAPGRAARLCAALANRTLVQRPSLLADRPRSVLVGELS